MTNILRHSNGDEVSLTLKSSNLENRNFELIIKDNGNVDNLKWGNGLPGINERCEQINAQFETHTDNGFCAQITLGKE